MSDSENLLCCRSSGFGECIVVFHVRHVLVFGERVIVLGETCILKSHDHTLTIGHD